MREPWRLADQEAVGGDGFAVESMALKVNNNRIGYSQSRSS